MYFKITAIIITLIALILAGVYIAKETPEKDNEQNFTEEVAKPWIEVLKPPVFKIDSQNNKKELYTGDELGENITIKTGENALANIYMSNGSVARIDSNTELVLEKGDYNKKTGGMIMKIFLSTGRIWSKIFELSTPESLWEVKTTNAVATVRGTSFGMEYENEKSSIIGNENKVLVSAIDLKTNEIIENANVVIEPNKFIEISKEDVLDIKENVEKLKEKIEETPADISNKEWIKRSKTADTKLEENRTLFLKRGVSNNSMKKELFKQQNADSAPNEAPKKDATPLKNTEDTKNINEPKPENPTLEKETTESIITDKPSPESLVLKIDGNTKNIIEDDVIKFKAILVMSDGTKKNVSNTAKWQVLGQIGNITSSGIFTAKLDVSISELGEGFGNVIATWKISDGVDILIGKSPTLNVKDKIEETIDFRG